MSTGTTAAPSMRRFVAHTMGMPISLALRGRHARNQTGVDAWTEAMAILMMADRVFSTYRSDSYVSRWGRGEISLEDCPKEVADVVALGTLAERQSGGAFTMRRTDRSGRQVIDPTGVVKGWAAESASAPLRRLDDTDFCLSAGGDLLCRTVDPGGSPWRIGIENPHDPSRLVARVPVHTGAVATSGTAHRGAHLVDGRSGLAPEGVASVTVVSDSLTWADIDATAAYAQGRDAARWLGSRAGRTGLVVWADGTATRVGA